MLIEIWICPPAIGLIDEYLGDATTSGNPKSTIDPPHELGVLKHYFIGLGSDADDKPSGDSILERPGPSTRGDSGNRDHPKHS